MSSEKVESRICQNCKGEFIIDSEDFNFYEKIKVPPPTFCPLCRAQRRFVFRNERRLFKVKNSFTGKDIFSLYPARDSKKNVTQEEWFNDDLDNMEYGRNYDFSKPFFEQFFELERVVPVFPLRVEFMVNSPYCANATALKNSYLCFNSSYSENCMYGNATDFSKDCIDNSHINHSERCYESFWLQNCYQCYFTIMTSESHNMWFCRNCLGCNDCVGCANLRKASYCIFNKQYSKEEYQKKIEEMKLSTVSGIREISKKARIFWNTQPTKSQHGLKNLNSYGSHVTHSKNVKDSFLIREGENLRYCQYLQVPKCKDCYDVSAWGDNMELNYEVGICGSNTYNLKFCSDCWPNSRNLEYCISMFSCSDCFGCVGLKKKQYCIFNKQYKKDEYLEMVEKIKKHMDENPYVDKKGRIYKYGEFFPIEFSPFGYNNSTAIQHFMMTKEEAKENDYPWIEIPHGEYKITKKAVELPNSINDVNEDILKEVIECEVCKNAYRILENELIFYKKEGISVPTMCHDCRFNRRTKDRLSIKLYEKTCMCAGETDTTGVYKNTIKHFHGDEPCVEEFKTGHAPEKKEIVYCENVISKKFTSLWLVY